MINSMNEKTNKFIELHMEKMKFSFWGEIHKSTIIKQFEATIEPEILREYYVSDIIFNGNMALIKWEKRHISLTDKQLQEITK